MLDFKGRFNEAHKKVLDEMLLQVSGVKAGKMFGYPGYYINGKLFACVYEEGVSLKLPEDLRERMLSQPGVERFVPMENRPMKEWLLIKKSKSADYRKLEDVFLASVQYVLELSQKPRKKSERGSAQ